MCPSLPAAARFRVWIARYDNWFPADSRAMPPRAVALEPAEEEPMSVEEAEVYVRAFNREALARSCQLWAVALRVAVRYEGDPQPGQVLELGRQEGPGS